MKYIPVESCFGCEYSELYTRTGECNHKRLDLHLDETLLDLRKIHPDCPLPDLVDRDAVIEECALMCEEMYRSYEAGNHDQWKIASGCASAIRGLKS